LGTAFGWLHADPETGRRDLPSMILLIFFSLNLLLGTFNLLPAPPLDGSTGIMVFMSEKRASRYLDWLRGNSYAMVGLLVAILFFRYAFQYINAIASYYLLPSQF
jgi:Zn-dependent protease